MLFSIFFMGVTFGLFLEAIIKETQRYEMSRYLIPELLIPAIALINIYIATELSNSVAEMLLWHHAIQNPLVTSVVYVTAFMIPHFWKKMRKHKHVLDIE